MVEFALVLPIFLLLLFGIIEYGTVFLVRNQIIDATSDAARSAVTYTDINSAITIAESALAADVIHASDGLIPSSDGCGTAAMTCTATQDTTSCTPPPSLVSGSWECLKVTVSYDYADHPVIALPFLPLPANLTASSEVVIGNGALVG